MFLRYSEHVRELALGLPCGPATQGGHSPLLWALQVLLKVQGWPVLPVLSTGPACETGRVRDYRRKEKVFFLAVCTKGLHLHFLSVPQIM